MASVWVSPRGMAVPSSDRPLTLQCLARRVRLAMAKCPVDQGLRSSPGADNSHQRASGMAMYQLRASRSPRLAGSVRQVRRLSHTGRRSTACGPRCSPGRSSSAQTGDYARRCAPARLRRAGDYSFVHLHISLGTALAGAAAGSFAPPCRGVLPPPVGNCHPGTGRAPPRAPGACTSRRPTTPSCGARPLRSGTTRWPAPPARRSTCSSRPRS